MSQPKAGVVVVGAGMAGLFAARRLQELGLQPLVLESAAEPGGLLAWTRVGATDLELFYHHLFGADRLTLGTLKQLDIPVDWRSTSTGFVDSRKEGIARFSGPQHLLTFSHLALPDRLRLGAALVRVALQWRQSADPAALDHITAQAWMASWGGAAIYERFFEPLIVKKFGCETPDISAAWLIGRLGMRAGRSWEGERLGYPRGGFRSLAFGLTDAVRRSGGEVRTGVRVQEVVVEDGRVKGVQVTTGADPARTFLAADALVLTPQPRALGSLLAHSGLDAESERMRRLPYQGTLTVLLGFERRLTDYYWLNVMDPGVSFGAIIEHTNFQPAALYEGPVVYLASYPDPGDPLWQLPDHEIVSRFVAELQRLLPSARGNALRWSRVARCDEASLIYRTGVAKLLPPRRAPVPGLYYTGMFRAYPKRPVEKIAVDAYGCAEDVATDLGLRGGA